MSYSAIVDIANSHTLMQRIIAAAASEGIAGPDSWVMANRWKLAATPGWAADWDYAKDTATANTNPDVGARTDVIDDAKILAAVQAIKPPAPPEPPVE